jgi:hypothetical protein
MENLHAVKLSRRMHSYHASPLFVLCVVLLQVVYSYAFGILFFHEHLTLFGVAGTALIAMGMACVTARTPPQQQQQQGDKLSDAARDAAGAGLGSQMFSGILQLEPEQGGSMRSSGSFLARMQSFQRLLADRRSGGEVSGGLGSVQYHAAGSGDAEGVGLLPVTQECSSGLVDWPASGQTAAAAAVAGAGVARSQHVPSSLLTVEEHGSELSSLQGRTGYAAAAEEDLAGRVAHDLELVAAEALQHRHVHLPPVPLQQQQGWAAVPSSVSAVATSQQAAAPGWSSGQP